MEEREVGGTVEVLDEGVLVDRVLEEGASCSLWIRERVSAGLVEKEGLEQE